MRFHRWTYTIPLRLRSLFRRNQVEQELDEELRYHVEHLIQEYVSRGMKPAEARNLALRAMGGVEQRKEQCRETRGLNMIDHLTRDLSYAIRMLKKSPGFTAMAVITLALCLGANLTIFAVIDSVLLRPLPFPESDRLVVMFNSYPRAGIDRSDASLTNYYERRGKLSAFSSITALNLVTTIIGETGSTEREEVGRVSPEFFTTLGVTPVIGRSFTEAEMTYQTDHVAILTDSYWRQHFNADPDVIGKDVRSDGIPRTIVGVLPPNFSFLSTRVKLFLPLSSDPDEHGIGNRHNGGVIVIGRLASGASLAEAQSQIDAHNAAHAAEFPNPQMVAEAGFHTVVLPLHADHVASIRPTLLLLQIGVFFLLLIGGVNLVNLLLIRASGRIKEMSIRQSLGATRRHIVASVMVESVLITLIGGLGGLVVGALGTRLLAVLGAGQLPLGAHIAFDGRIAFVALLAAITLGIVLAIPISLFSIRRHLTDGLQSESRTGTASAAMQRLRHVFIVAQIALAFVLLAGAGLLGLSLKRAMDISPGFRADHVLAGRFSLPWKGYQNPAAFLSFADRLLENIGHQPGVTAAGVVTNVPLNGSYDTNVISVVGHKSEPNSPVVVHRTYSVIGDYFSAMGIPLRQGRYLDNSDSHSAESTCVVDEDFARRYWPAGEAIGQRLFIGAEKEDGDSPFTVVGIVGAARQADLTDSRTTGAVYFPYSRYFSRTYFLVVRTSAYPESLTATLRKTVRAIDPELPLDDIRSMDVRIADSLVTRRSPALLTGIFAVVALILAAVGTYGVLSYAVVQRRREIGVRMALGALPGQIRGHFLSLGLRLLAVGITLGVIGAWVAGNAMRGILLDTVTFNTTILAVTGGILILITVIACLVPSHRAARVSPMEVLGNE